MIESILQILRTGIRIKIEMEIKLNEPTHEPQIHTAECGYCDWFQDGYKSAATAQRALRAHHQHCTAYAEQVLWIAQMHSGESQEG